MPCIFLPKCIHRKIPVESVLKLFICLFSLLYGESNILSDTEIAINYQHISMYSLFSFTFMIEILMFYKVDLPDRLEHAVFILSFILYDLILFNHLHDREALDVKLHFLFACCIFMIIVFAVLEFYNPKQVLFTYGRVLFFTFQGVWLIQIGYIMYPPEGYKIWDMTSHDSIMSATIRFCTLVLVLSTCLIIQVRIIQFIYNKSERFAKICQELVILDHLEELKSTNREKRLINSSAEEKLLEYNQLNYDSSEDVIMK